MTMNRVLWIVQIAFGLYFIGVGITHLVLPEGLPEFISWMYDLSRQQHLAAGIAEIAGGLGLILPGLTGILPQLTVWAAVGLISIMVAAIFWHYPRDEFSQIGVNVFNIVVLAFVAYGRARLHPHPARA